MRAASEVPVFRTKSGAILESLLYMSVDHVTSIQGSFGFLALIQRQILAAPSAEFFPERTWSFQISFPTVDVLGPRRREDKSHPFFHLKVERTTVYELPNAI